MKNKVQKKIENTKARRKRKENIIKKIQIKKKNIKKKKKMKIKT